MTDIDQRVIEAVVALVDTHATVTAFTGRGSLNIVPYRQLSTATLPVVAYALIVGVPIGGAGKNHRVELQLTSVAEGNDASAQANEFKSVVSTVLDDASGFAGLDLVAERIGPRRAIDLDREGTRGLAQVDLSVTFRVKE